MLNGEYNIRGVCLSVPCVVGSSGIEKIIDGDITAGEQAALKNSSEKLQKVYNNLKV